MLFNVKPPYLIAHRGASSLAPENTLYSFQKAFLLGAKFCELDVQLTKDAKVVVLHDRSLLRTTNVLEVYPKRSFFHVDEFDFQELAKLSSGRWFVAKHPFGQALGPGELEPISAQKIPLLQEVLLLAKSFQAKVNVEIKDLTGIWDDHFVVKKVLEAIFELEMEEDVVISSFNLNYLRIIKSLYPKTNTAVLWSGPNENPLELVYDLKAQAYHTDYVPSQDILSQFQKKSIALNVFTVNSEQTIKSLLAKGVSGVFTDYIQDFINLGFNQNKEV